MEPKIHTLLYQFLYIDPLKQGLKRKEIKIKRENTWSFYT